MKKLDNTPCVKCGATVNCVELEEVKRNPHPAYGILRSRRVICYDCLNSELDWGLG